jgi:hypothetical protein
VAAGTARFGSWTGALEAAGLPTIRRDGTAEEILDAPASGAFAFV